MELTSRLTGFNTEVYFGAVVHCCHFDQPLVSEVVNTILERCKKWPNSSIIRLIEITPEYSKSPEIINLENGTQLALSKGSVKLLPLVR